MNQEIAKKWVTELRSGRYQQGTGYLRKEGKYCCLGVLCELAVADGIISWELPRMEGGPDTIGNTKDSGLPPSTVCDWAGLKSPEGTLPDDSYLSKLNDEGLNFNEIAELIELNVDSL